MRLVGHSVDFSCDHCRLNMFSSVNKKMLASVGEYFSATFFEWLSLSLLWEFASLISGVWQFLSTNTSQGPATRLRRGGVFNYHLSINLPLSMLVKEF